MKHRINIFNLYGVLAFTAVLLAGCTKETDMEEGSGTPQYRTVTVTLPPLVRESTAQEANLQKATARQTRQAAGHSLLTVERSYMEGVATQPSTRGASHPEYTNVWLLQFDVSGNKLRSEYVGTVAADANITATVTVAENCTLYVVTNGPGPGATFAPESITALEATSIVRTNEDQPGYIASLSDITVEEYNGVGRIVSIDGEPLTFLLRSLTPTLSAYVCLFIDGWEITGMELYNVVNSSKYKGSASLPSPAADVANFSYTDKTLAGKASPSYTPESEYSASSVWYPYENRQELTAEGQAAISVESDRNHANSPTYATFLRMRIASTAMAGDPATPVSTATFDIYPGKTLTDFDLQYNHSYGLFIAIDGTEEDLKKYAAEDTRITIAGAIAEPTP